MNVLTALQAAYPEFARARGCLTHTLSESAFHRMGGGALYGAATWARRGTVAHRPVDLAPAVRVNGIARLCLTGPVKARLTRGVVINTG
ncbi:hypothetical protein ACWCXX_39935 [Streptomyces sp. NPDC001732]